jgi:hypothetical protein
MKLSDFSAQKVGDTVASSDPDGWPYRSGPKLVAFFNKMGLERSMVKVSQAGLLLCKRESG